MPTVGQLGIDDNPENLYIVMVYVQGENIAQYVTSTYEKAQEFVEVLMEDTDNIDCCGIRPVVLDSLIDNVTIH